MWRDDGFKVTITSPYFGYGVTGSRIYHSKIGLVAVGNSLNVVPKQYTTQLSGQTKGVKIIR